MKCTTIRTNRIPVLSVVLKSAKNQNYKADNYNNQLR
jgi:hypothetical protein